MEGNILSPDPFLPNPDKSSTSQIDYDNIKRGELYIVDLSPVTGSEQGGRCPCCVIQNDLGNRYSQTVIVAAITSRFTKAKLPTQIPIPRDSTGLLKDSIIMLEQIRTVDKQRITERIGYVGDDILLKIDKAILLSIGLMI